MGRPRKYDRRTSTGVRFPPKLLEELKAAAEARNVSVNFLVNVAVKDMLDRLIPVDELRWTRDG